MINYKDGIFTFKLQEDEVLNKVKMDSVELQNFYSSTKENYSWPDRVNFSEIFTHGDSAIQYYYGFKIKVQILILLRQNIPKEMTLMLKMMFWA